MHRSYYRLLTGAAAIALSASAATSQELTIFWAEWDPANYLQELVNEYEAETGVVVTVETTPWQDFQTKAFTEFNAQGSAYDLVVGDSQWLGAASTGGHYVDLSSFVTDNGDFELVSAVDGWQSLFAGSGVQPLSKDGASVTLSPASTDTDGFFFAMMKRKG